MYRRKDAYYQRAKKSGFRSRAAFKLLELAESERLFRPGDRVVDLGAWPGGWLQVASAAVGPRGTVVGVDRRAFEPVALKNVTIIVGDVADDRVRQQVWDGCEGSADVLLSDLAPSLSGIRDRDAAEASRLLEIVLSYVATGLRSGGSLLTKMFMSGEFDRGLAEIRRGFEAVRVIRPQATRKGSAELYVLARGYRGRGGNS